MSPASMPRAFRPRVGRNARRDRLERRPGYLYCAPRMAVPTSVRRHRPVFVLRCRCERTGGGSGIRTHGAFRHAGFQDRCFRPLSHPSGCGVRRSQWAMYGTHARALNDGVETFSRIHGRFLPLSRCPEPKEGPIMVATPRIREAANKGKCTRFVVIVVRIAHRRNVYR